MRKHEDMIKLDPLNLFAFSLLNAKKANIRPDVNQPPYKLAYQLKTYEKIESATNFITLRRVICQESNSIAIIPSVGVEMHDGMCT